MKKWYVALLCVIMAGLTLSGCAANASGTTATAAPIATHSPAASMQPAATIAPETSPGMSGTLAGPATTAGGMENSGMENSAMTPAQAGKLAEQIAEAVERISEVEDAEVVVSNERVLVAVEFDDQYQAGLDDRMKETITEAVKKVDDSLTEVSITDDDTLYGQVKGLGERLAKSTGLEELADDFGDLWDRIIGR